MRLQKKPQDKSFFKLRETKFGIHSHKIYSGYLYASINFLNLLFPFPIPFYYYFFKFSFIYLFIFMYEFLKIENSSSQQYIYIYIYRLNWPGDKLVARKPVAWNLVSTSVSQGIEKVLDHDRGPYIRACPQSIEESLEHDRILNIFIMQQIGTNFSNVFESIYNILTITLIALRLHQNIPTIFDFPCT